MATKHEDESRRLGRAIQLATTEYHDRQQRGADMTVEAMVEDLILAARPALIAEAAPHDALYSAVKEEIALLRARSKRNVSLVHWTEAERLQAILNSTSLQAGREG
jgi:hypothetical protein